ncbi:hypothetical protein G6M89_20850 [Natronolimnobius sp. AArcel1]|uniref:hypothetical protein n=1 Tax=Natronolimnobius sp. AArcel1 TaxID=1679093 RepID=UPI0013EB1BED|nr:hypothetical protein [Natronolimnobius sp. AArcel1]NGM71411.1 hypothetical protein [Natronolimnobius sp. AArcel1]
MYANNPRDLQGLDRPDASPENHPEWTTLTARTRDILFAIACLEQTAQPAIPAKLKPALQRWYPDVEPTQLHADLQTLTHKNYLTEQPATSTYQLTPDAQNLLETYTSHLQQILNPDTITLELERPLTLGDIEQTHTKLLEECR